MTTTTRELLIKVSDFELRQLIKQNAQMAGILLSELKRRKKQAVGQKVTSEHESRVVAFCHLFFFFLGIV